MKYSLVAFDQITAEVYSALPEEYKLKFQNNVTTIINNSVKYLEYLDDIKASDAIYNESYKEFTRWLSILVDTYMELLFDNFSKTGAVECPICYEDKECLIIPKCKHHFCRECLLKEYDNKNNCPMCRGAIVLPT